MKSLKEYALNIPEADYHAYPAWSQSLIARYARNGFQALATLHQPCKITPEMEFGSLVDRLVTGEGAAFDEYTVLSIVVPEAEKKMLDTLASYTGNKPYHLISDEELASAQQQAAYQSRFKLDTVKSRLAPYIPYYDALASGKKIVSSIDWNDATEMASAIKNSDYLKDIFGETMNEDIEYIYQPQFVREMVLDEETGETAPVKIMLDLMRVNHTDKTIQPVDLKTSSMPAYQFADHFVKMRYDIQASEYTDVLQEVISAIPEYADYRILPYLYTDISRVDKVPVTFEYDPRSESQINGLTVTTGEKQYTYKNWKRLLLEIIHYEEQGAQTPSYITTTAANDLLTILNFSK